METPSPRSLACLSKEAPSAPDWSEELILPRGTVEGTSEALS